MAQKEYRLTIWANGERRVYLRKAERKAAILGSVLRDLIDEGFDISEMRISIIDVNDIREKIEKAKDEYNNE